MNEMSKPKTDHGADDGVVVHVAEELRDLPFEVVRFDGMTDEDVELQAKLVRAVLERAKRA